MAWKKKEEETYPPLTFKLGDFIRAKVKMKSDRKKVINTFYYENGIVIKGYEYSPKTRLFEVCARVYTQKEPEEIKAELTNLMMQEEIEQKLKKEEQSTFIQK